MDGVLSSFRKLIKLMPLWKGISTHEPEEVSLLRVHKRLCATWKTGRQPLLILAPRHVLRIPKILNMAQSIGWKPSEIALHSKHAYSDNTCVLIIDSYGVLSSFFRHCKIVFVGNSLLPPGGGHNIAEALHYKCVVLHGVHIKNFKETWSYLNSLNSARPVTCTVQDETKLFERVQYLLNYPEKAREWGEIGFKTVKEAERHVVFSVLDELLFQHLVTKPK